MAATSCACINLTKFGRSAEDLTASPERRRSHSSAHGLCQVAITAHVRTLDLSSRSLGKASCLPLSVDASRRLNVLRSSLKDNAKIVLQESSHEDSIKVAVQEAQEATELAQATFQNLPPPSEETPRTVPQLSPVARERMLRRRNERKTYLVAAMASSVGFTFLAAAAVVYRFAWQANASGELPLLEILGTFSLAVGAAVGMEFWACWAHKALWHDSLWSMHESHHRPREGPFELNDVFAIINAVPAIALIAYGFFSPGLVPGLCFGAGLGITLFGMSYMFVHDGLVHKRFPVGPLANVPYFQRVAAAHQMHHADKFEGVPFGLFLGPLEIERVGGLADLEALLAARQQDDTKATSR